MFNLKDEFKAYDDNKQPYCFEVERHTDTENLHAGVTDEGFSFKSIGNRFVLNTPPFKTGKFKTEFKITYLAEYNPVFAVIFQYDEKLRKGRGIRFEYDLNGFVNISLADIDKINTDIVETKKIDGLQINEESFFECEITVEEKRIVCRIDSHEVAFECACKEGRLAIERKNFIGELILKKIEFQSEDEFEIKNILPKRTVEIPLRNGGDIPYKFTWEVNRIKNDYYLMCSLDGGTRTRRVDREDRPGQYVAEKDFMDSPYVGLRNNETENRYFMCSGTVAFIDPNIFWDCQKRFFGDTELPLMRCYKLKNFISDRDTEIFFGYKNLKCSNYFTQCGAGEFRYDADGKALYGGEPLDGRDVFDIYSPFDKKVMSYIPDKCYKRDAVEEHLKYNHYFDVSENISFRMEFKTKSSAEYMTAKAKILNVYETEVISESDAELIREDWKYGYNKVACRADFAPLDVGVYKIEFSVYFGGELYHRETKAFEVFDENSDVIPALKSGLPFVFSMPNEHKWLERNSFDLWNPAHSCDVEHYISCVTDTPIEAERRRIWEIIKPFKREWFAWLGSRTCRDWEVEKHPDVAENADYLYYPLDTPYPLRYDLWKIKCYKRRGFMEMFHSFLRDNPDLAEKLDYKEGMENFAFADQVEYNLVNSRENKGAEGFTYEHLKNLMQTCHKEWFDYAVEKHLETIKKQNEELKKYNPGFKRSSYGPFSAYVHAANSYHCIKAACMPYDNRLADDIYTGFIIFEDYPFSCSYQTYRNTFAVMTMLLHAPHLRIYPEQYKSAVGGCIDGAVKFANPPMGKYDMAPYMNSTHSFEYVFNTPYRLSDGYHYWNTYGFHRADFEPERMNEIVRDWKYVIENKPKKPVRSLAFIAEYSDDEDIYDDSIIDADGFTKLNNTSDNSHGFVHECSREAGVPNGFAVKFDVLKDLSADECDLLVLPTLKGVKEEYISEIRRLYNEGTNLLAVSDVGSLEDIFMVERSENTSVINSVEYNGVTEYVYERTAEFKYKSVGAETVLKAGGDIPAVLRTERTALINTAVTDLGAEGFEESPGKTKHIVGKLIKECLADIIKSLSNPLVYSENTGISLFETESGKTTVLAIDYTPFDNTDKHEKQAVIKINADGFIDAKSDEKLFVGKKDGCVKEILFNIKPHGFVFVDLITDEHQRKEEL